MPSCLEQFSRANVAGTPFTRLLAFDVYDGPVSGLVFCGAAREAFVFRLMAWDEQQERRVFGIAPLAGDIAGRVISVLAEIQSPRWPEWWLNPPPDERLRRQVDGAIAEAVGGAGPVVGVALSTNLLGEIERLVTLTSESRVREFQALSRRVADSAEVSDSPYADWLRFLDRDAGL
jgi:hypothetical protein